MWSASHLCELYHIPIWLTIKSDSSLNEKFPGGVEAQAAHLGEGGYTIEPGKGKKPPRVKDFEKSLQKLWRRLKPLNSKFDSHCGKC